MTRTNQFKERIDSLLMMGNREFSTTLAALARIEDNYYELSAVQSNSGAYVPGEKYSLGESFCREVFTHQQVIAVTTSDSAPLALHHPLYQALPLECYIGAPIYRQGEPWGSLDFSSMAQREFPFGKNERQLIESLANEISQLISANT